jgi:hypothetical protein
MINTSTLHDSKVLYEFQEQQRNKIKELQQLVENLQEEIRLIQEFNDRLDDL